MGKKRPEAGLVLIIVLLVTSIGIIHHRKIMPVARTQSAQLGLQDTIDLITPSLVSKSFNAISQTLAQFDIELIMNVVQQIVATDSNLDREEKATLLINIIANTDDTALHKKLYELLKINYAHDPIYSYGILDNSSVGVGRIQKIAQRLDKQTAQSWADQSYARAVVLDDVDMLDKLYAAGARITQELASQLLYDAVASGNQIAFVPSFVRNMAADPNFSPDKRNTPLIKAVELNNEPMVRALLDQGANPELMVDEEVGTPAQVAYEKGFLKIEQLLKQLRKK